MAFLTPPHPHPSWGGYPHLAKLDTIRSYTMYREKGMMYREKGIRPFSWILLLVRRYTGRNAFHVPEKEASVPGKGHLVYRGKRHLLFQLDTTRG